MICRGNHIDTDPPVSAVIRIFQRVRLGRSRMLVVRIEHQLTSIHDGNILKAYSHVALAKRTYDAFPRPGVSVMLQHYPTYTSYCAEWPLFEGDYSSGSKNADHFWPGHEPDSVHKNPEASPRFSWKCPEKRKLGSKLDIRPLVNIRPYAGARHRNSGRPCGRRNELASQRTTR